jgi:hypothetical protein
MVVSFNGDRRCVYFICDEFVVEDFQVNLLGNLISNPTKSSISLLNNFSVKPTQIAFVGDS